MKLHSGGNTGVLSLPSAQQKEDEEVDVGEDQKPFSALKQDVFTPLQPTVATQQVSHLHPEVLAQLIAESAKQEKNRVEARPSFTLTTSLPEERFIKNPASKAATTTFLSTGVGVLLGGLFGAMVIKLRENPTGLAYAIGAGLGVLMGGVSGLLLGATVLGRMSEQQQEMENRIHLVKTRVLVEQLTPIALDPIQVKIKRKKKVV